MIDHQFLGAATGDSVLGRQAPLPTAVGGTQRITVVTGPSNESPTFSRAFDAALSNDALLLAGVVPPT